MCGREKQKRKPAAHTLVNYRDGCHTQLRKNYKNDCSLSSHDSGVYLVFAFFKDGGNYFITQLAVSYLVGFMSEYVGFRGNQTSTEINKDTRGLKLNRKKIKNLKAIREKYNL